MSSAALSPSTRNTSASPSLRQQHPAEAHLFSKYTLHDSPRLLRLSSANSSTGTARNYSQINAISSAGGTTGAASISRPHRRWRAVLEHLAPPRLLSVPKRAAPSTAASASPRQKLSTLSQASNSLPPTLADDASSTAEGGPENLLQTLLKKIHPSKTGEYGGQPRTALAELCTLCASTPDAADLCVAANGIGVILDVLTRSSVQLRGPQPVSATDFLNVEVNEKALLLLQLLISSSHNGCEALLRHSSTIDVLGKKILRVSESCTASSIAILSTLCRHSDAADFLTAVSAKAIPSKLVVVLQVANRDSTKRRAGRLLRLLEDRQQQEAPLATL